MELFFSRALSKLGKLGTFLELARPWNGVLCGLLALLGYDLLGPMQLYSALILFTVFTLSYMSSTILNDIYDKDIDEINMPYRPLQRKSLTNREAYTFSLLLAGTSLTLSLLLGIHVIMLLALFLIVGLFYSLPPFFMSRRVALAQATLAFTSVTIPLYAGMSYSNMGFLLNQNSLIFVISMTILAIFIFIIKDFKDIKGDNLLGKKTLATRIGIRNAQRMALAGTLLSYGGLILAFNTIRPIKLITAVLLVLVLVELLIAELMAIWKSETGFAGVRLGFFTLLLVLLFS